MPEVTLEFLSQQVERVLEGQREIWEELRKLKGRQAEIQSTVLGLRRTQGQDSRYVGY